MEAVESAARHKSPEELEMDAITREMEQELLHEHVKVSRVVSERVHNGKTQYLVLWRGLPYKDCTWEDVTHRPFIEHETAQPAIGARAPLPAAQPGVNGQHHSRFPARHPARTRPRAPSQPGADRRHRGRPSWRRRPFNRNASARTRCVSLSGSTVEILLQNRSQRAGLTLDRPVLGGSSSWRR